MKMPCSEGEGIKREVKQRGQIKTFNRSLVADTLIFEGVLKKKKKLSLPPPHRNCFHYLYSSGCVNSNVNVHRCFQEDFNYNDSIANYGYILKKIIYKGVIQEGALQNLVGSVKMRLCRELKGWAGI